MRATLNSADDLCHFCKKPIRMGDAYYAFDLNIGACAAGAGNYAKAHSKCGNPMRPDDVILKEHWVARCDAERRAARYKVLLSEALQSLPARGDLRRRIIQTIGEE